ncbi:TRAP transporter small permease subunit [Alkalihalophilus marmarensis]|uniref:TRAP transporter small permease subunit n=1 Tax=Alkalihalophilus marmarensis TaxID=521377 RepID=UPI002DB7CB8B|nr:TRAP transporter small permease [Alkalihalophilus marmarensis]MEC2073299.1 TRAP transporter small permease [Alkalihalophilus marmarensis]
MTKLIHSFEMVVSFLNNISAKISAALLFLMMILTFSDVTGRFLWRPVTGTYELTYLWLALIVFLSLGYTQQKKGHISVGVLIDKLPVRGQAVVDIITYLIMLSILGLMSRQTFLYAQQISNNVTGDLRLPVYMFVIACAVGILLYALTVILDLLKALRKVVNPNES